MLSWLIHRKINVFEKELSYDMDYARDLLGTSLQGMMLFHKASGMRDYREGLPKDAWYAAKLFATRGGLRTLHTTRRVSTRPRITRLDMGTLTPSLTWPMRRC